MGCIAYGGTIRAYISSAAGIRCMDREGFVFSCPGGPVKVTLPRYRNVLIYLRQEIRIQGQGSFGSDTDQSNDLVFAAVYSGLSSHLDVRGHEKEVMAAVVIQQVKLP